MDSNTYNWTYSEVSDKEGIPGQGNKNPASLFNNHRVFISGEYYDPSYGIKHASLADIEKNAIDGYYFVFPPGPISEASLNIDLNGDGDKTDNYNGWPVNEPTVGIDVNGDGDKLDLNVGYSGSVYLFRKNPAGMDLIERRVDF